MSKLLLKESPTIIVYTRTCTFLLDFVLQNHHSEQRVLYMQMSLAFSQECQKSFTNDACPQVAPVLGRVLMMLFKSNCLIDGISKVCMVAPGETASVIRVPTTVGCCVIDHPRTSLHCSVPGSIYCQYVISQIFITANFIQGLSLIFAILQNTSKSFISEPIFKSS